MVQLQGQGERNGRCPCVATLSGESDGPRRGGTDVFSRRRCRTAVRLVPFQGKREHGAELALKPGVVPADVAGVSVDRRLLNHWQREQVARRKARAALPAQWRNDPRPEMHQVVDVYVELVAAERQQNVVPLALEDR